MICKSLPPPPRESTSESADFWKRSYLGLLEAHSRAMRRQTAVNALLRGARCIARPDKQEYHIIMSRRTMALHHLQIEDVIDILGIE